MDNKVTISRDEARKLLRQTNGEEFRAKVKELPDWRFESRRCPRCGTAGLRYAGQKDEYMYFTGKGYNNNRTPVYDAFMCLPCGRHVNIDIEGNEEDPEVFRLLNVLKSPGFE